MSRASTNTWIPLRPPCSSPSKWSQKVHCLSWTQGSYITLIDAYPPWCFGRVYTQYLDFWSHYPLAHKVAVAHTLFNRAEKICSEKDHVAKALQSNDCLRGPVVKNWRPLPHSQLPEWDTPAATVTLPYVRHLSETMQRILAPLRIRTCFRNTLHTAANAGQVEGLHTLTATSRRGVLNPLRHMLKSVHCPNG